MKALRISILCLFVLWSGSLYAQDFGLNLDSSAESAKTSATNLDSNLKLLEKANLWANLDFGSWGAFKMSGTVNFQKQTATGQYSGIWADLDQFKLVMGAANPQKGIDGFSMALGRDVVTDPSGYIYSNAEDGIFVDFGMGKITTNFRFGYTGLVSRQSSGVSMSLADANIAAGDGQFGPPRFVSIAELAVSDVFGQNLSLSSLVQQDMNKSSDLVAEKDDTYVSGRGGIVDTQYATLKLSGPVYSTLYHTSFFTYGMGRELNYIDSEYRYKPIQSWLWGRRLD